MTKNNQLFSRIVFLGIFVLAVILVFWIGRVISQKGSGNSTAVGNFEKGKVVLVEYADFQCPACGLYYPLVKQLKSESGDKMEVVFKHFPLKSIHKNADLASRASEAALIQGKFWEMHDILFEKQNEWSNSGQARSLFTAYAVSLGMNQQKFVDDIDSDSVKERVNSDYQEGVGLRVNGTPTLFLNGKKITNPRSYDEFKKLIQDQINK